MKLESVLLPSATHCKNLAPADDYSAQPSPLPVLDDIPPSAYSAIAVAIALPIIMGFFKATRFFSRNQKVHATLSFAQLTQTYGKWDILIGVPFFGFIAISTYLFFHGFNALARTMTPNVSSDTIYLTATPVFWLIPAFFLGIVAAALPSMLFLKLVLGNRYHEFECYSDMKAGFNTNRAFAFFGVIIVGLCAIGIYAGLHFYWRFDKDGFVISPFTELKEYRYGYSDIRELRHVAKVRAPNGDIKHKPYYEIITHDGECWSSRWAPNDDAKLINRLFETVRQRSRLPIKRYDFAPETPAPRNGK